MMAPYTGESPTIRTDGGGCGGGVFMVYVSNADVPPPEGCDLIIPPTARKAPSWARDQYYRAKYRDAYTVHRQAQKARERYLKRSKPKDRQRRPHVRWA